MGNQEDLTLRISGDSTGATRAAGELSVALIRAQKDLEAIKKTIAEFASAPALDAVLGAQLDAAQQKVAGLKDEIKNVGPVAQASAATAQQSFEGLATAFNAAGTALHSTGRLLTEALTIPIVGAAAASEHFAADFQTYMTRVQTLAGASGEEVKAMGQKVLDLAPTVGIGPAELAKGLFVVESAGFRGAAAMDVLTISAKMSALGMGTTETVARSLIGVMFSYTQQHLSAAQAGDILVKTVQLGNMKIDELVPALARVNPLAAAMGIKFQDVAAAMATFTHMGASSEVAATGMRAMLSNILNDSAKTEKGFKALSVALGDSTMTMVNFRKEIEDKGFDVALVNLVAKAKSTGDEGISLLNKIFPNVRALTEVLAIAGAQSEQLLSIHQQIWAAGGVMEAGFKATQDTFNQRWKEFTAAADVLWIKLGNDLLPVLTDLVTFLREDAVPVIQAVVDGFSGLSDGSKLVVIGVAAVLAAVGPVLYILGSFATAIGGILGLLGKLEVGAVGATGMGGAAGALTTLGVALGNLTRIFGAFYVGWEAGKIIDHFTGLSDVVERVATSWTNAFGHGRDVQFQTMIANNDALALASQRAGHAITDLSEAARINAEWSQLHVKGINDVVASLNSLGIASVQQTKATGDLLDQVKHLTEAQRAQIDELKRSGLTASEIGKEMGIAASVIGVYEKQAKAAAMTTAEFNQQLKLLHATAAASLQLEPFGPSPAVPGTQTFQPGNLWGPGAIADLKPRFSNPLNAGTPQDVPTSIDLTTNAFTTAFSTIFGQLGTHLTNLTNEFSKMGQIAGGSFDGIAKSVGGLFSALSVGQTAGKGFKTDWTAFNNPDATTGQQVSAGIGMATNAAAMVAAMDAATKGGGAKGIAGGALEGATTGGQIVPVAGAIVGAVVGAIIGAVRSTEESSLVNQPRQQFFAAQGGLDTLGAKLTTATGSAGTAQQLEQAVFNAKTATDYNTAITAVTKAMSDYTTALAAAVTQEQALAGRLQTIYDITPALQSALDAAFNAKTPADYQTALKGINSVLDAQDAKQQQLDAALQKYGLSWTQAGTAAKQAHLDTIAQGLIADFTTLTAAGVGVNDAVKGMGPNLSTFVQQAKAAGVEVPESMRKIIQSSIDAGDLFDKDGKKITDMSQLGLTFGVTMQTTMKTVGDQIQHLADVIQTTLGGAFTQVAATATTAFNSIPKQINIGVNQGDLTLPQGAETAVIPSFPGRLLEQVVKPGLVNVHPGDVVGVPKMGLGGLTVNVNVEGSIIRERDLMDSVEAHLADVLRGVAQFGLR